MLGNGLIGAPQGPEGLGFLSQYMLHVLTLGLMWGIQDKLELEFLCGVRPQASVLQVLFSIAPTLNGAASHLRVSNPALERRHLVQVGSRRADLKHSVDVFPTVINGDRWELGGCKSRETEGFCDNPQPHQK